MSPALQKKPYRCMNAAVAGVKIFGRIAITTPKPKGTHLKRLPKKKTSNFILNNVYRGLAGFLILQNKSLCLADRKPNITKLLIERNTNIAILQI